MRVVLVDFDWRDADTLPELLARPGISVRLVAGERPDDPGVALAELCELPHTTDLADLTREIFDLALVSERSARRTQIEGLLLALGTPCVSPDSLLRGGELEDAQVPAVEAPLALHAAALENALGGADFDALAEHALPDVGADAPTAPPPVVPVGRTELRIPSLDEFPSSEDRSGLERALADLVSGTGAKSAELRAGHPNEVELLARVGGEDPLLQGLIELAMRLETAQVVSRLTGPQEGKAWGAWPFRTTRSRGVLAAAGIDPASGWTTWQRTVDELREAWDRRDREQAGPAFPLIPEDHHGWLDVPGFRSAVSLAIERNRRDGLSFAVHRFDLPDRGTALGIFCERLPEQLRDTDRLCRPEPRIVLLLTACTPDAFAPVRRRITELWDAAWRESGGPPGTPEVVEHRTGLTTAADSERFHATVTSWLPA